MLSLFSKGDSNPLQEKESSSFNVTSFLGLPSAPSSSKKVSGGAKDKAENYLDFTKELKELKAIKPLKSMDQKVQKKPVSKDKAVNRDSNDWPKPSQPMRNSSYDKSKEVRRDDDRNKRDSDRRPAVNQSSDRKPVVNQSSNSNGTIIKKKIIRDDSPPDSPQIRKSDSQRPILSGSLSGSKVPAKSTSQQSSSKPIVNRQGPVTAEARGKALNPSLYKQPNFVGGSGQSARPSSGSLSGSKLGSSTMKPSGSQSSLNRPSSQMNKSLSGKPLPSQSKPSGNMSSRPINGKPAPSSMGSRPSSQQPVKKPVSNGMASRPSSNGTLSKAKPIVNQPPPQPAVRYINGKPVPIRGPDGKPVESSNLGKRPGEHLGGSRFEPSTGKKPSFNSIFKEKPKKLKRHDYSDEDDDYDDDFIDDDDQDAEAKAELNKIFGGYRKRVERTRHLVDDVDDMEAGYDDIQKEEYMSKLIAAEEDARELKYILREQEEEMDREARAKKKRLRLD